MTKTSSRKRYRPGDLVELDCFPIDQEGMPYLVTEVDAQGQPTMLALLEDNGDAWGSVAVKYYTRVWRAKLVQPK